VELLLVMAILTILAALVAPSLSSVFRGSNLNRAGQMLGDQFALARQEAVTRNRDVIIQFSFITNGATTGWSGIQILRVEYSSGGVTTNVPVSRRLLLPEGVIIATNGNLSPLLSSSTFRFRANGVLESTITATNNYVTLINAADSGKPLANYYTVQINPMTGKSKVFRP